MGSNFAYTTKGTLELGLGFGDINYIISVINYYVSWYWPERFSEQFIWRSTLYIAQAYKP